MSKLDFIKCVLAAVLIFLLTPFVCWLLPPSTNSNDNIALCRAIQTLKDVRIHEPISNELSVAIDYTVDRYTSIGRMSVNVRWLPEYVAGVNAPWCPGMTLNSDVWGESVFVDAELLLHEAMHDYPPYLGHAHVYPITQEFEQAYWRLHDSKLERVR